jgi:hypothetical protein
MWSPNPVVRDQRVMPLEGRRSMYRDVRDIGIGFHSGSLRISSRLNFRGRMRLHARLPETNASARAHVALIMPAPATTIVVTTLPVSVIADRLDPELQ